MPWNAGPRRTRRAGRARRLWPPASGRLSFDEFLRFCQAATKDTDGDGRTDQWGYDADSWFSRMPPLIWASGGDMLEYTRGTSLALRPAWDRTETWRAIQWQAGHPVAGGPSSGRPTSSPATAWPPRPATRTRSGPPRSSPASACSTTAGAGSSPTTASRSARPSAGPRGAPPRPGRATRRWRWCPPSCAARSSRTARPAPPPGGRCAPAPARRATSATAPPSPTSSSSTPRRRSSATWGRPPRPTPSSWSPRRAARGAGARARTESEPPAGRVLYGWASELGPAINEELAPGYLGATAAGDAATTLNPRLQAIIDKGKAAGIDPEKPNITLG
jgi:hypothetical protein